MKGLEIHLKSGQSFTVDASDVTTSRNRITNELISIEWVNPENAKRKLHMVRPEDVSALVVIR